MDKTIERRRLKGESVELVQQRRDFPLDRATIDQAARTVEISFSSETPYERWYGMEILDHAPSSIRLGRLNDGGALLVNHDIDDQVGVVEKAWVGADRKGRARVRFGKSARASEIFQDVTDGIRSLVSVAYWVHQMKLESTVGDVDTYRITDWEPLENSIVAVPADPGVGVGRSVEEKRITARIIKDTPTMEPEVKEKEAPKPAAAPTAADITLATKDARETEVARIREIEAIGKTFNEVELARAYIDDGKTPAQMQKQVLANIAKRQESKQGEAGKIGLNEKEVRQFSFVRLMNALANPVDKRAQDAAAYEREVSSAAAEKSKTSPKGFLVPVDILRAPMLGLQGKDGVEQLLARMFRRDLNVGTTTAGGDLVATDLLAASFIDLLRKRMVLQRAGATVLRDLVGNIAIPRQTGGATAYWVAESNAPTESQQAVDQVTMSPKTVGAFTDYSRKLLIQSSIDVEAFCRNDIVKVLGLEMDRVGLYGSGSSNQPNGVKNQTGVNTVDFAAAAPTFAEIVSMETAIAADDADVDQMAYLVNAVGRGGLKGTQKFATYGDAIWENNEVNGYPGLTSNQIESGDFWIGNWADLVFGMWSGLDIMVDPFTGATSGTVRIVALQDLDVAVRHGESFCRGNNTL